MNVLSGHGGLLLYLDYDGVLHHENVLWHPRMGAYLSAPEEFKLFQHVGLLEDLLADCPRSSNPALRPLRVVRPWRLTRFSCPRWFVWMSALRLDLDGGQFDDPDGV